MKFITNLSAWEDMCTENNNNKCAKCLFHTFKILLVWEAWLGMFALYIFGPDNLNGLKSNSFNPLVPELNAHCDVQKTRM